MNQREHVEARMWKSPRLRRVVACFCWKRFQFHQETGHGDLNMQMDTLHIDDLLYWLNRCAICFQLFCLMKYVSLLMTMSTISHIHARWFSQLIQRLWTIIVMWNSPPKSSWIIFFGRLMLSRSWCCFPNFLTIFLW